MRNWARARKRKKKSIFGEPAVHTRMALHDTRMDLPSTRSIRKWPEGWKIQPKDKLLVIRVPVWAIRVPVWAIRVPDWAIRVSEAVLRAIRVPDWAIRVWDWAIRVSSPESGKAQLNSYLEGRKRFFKGWTILERKKTRFESWRLYDYQRIHMFKSFPTIEDWFLTKFCNDNNVNLCFYFDYE